MQSKIIGGGIIILILIVAVYFIITGIVAPGHGSTQTTSGTTTAAAGNSSSALFSSSQYAQYSYELYPNMSTAGQAHIVNSDFNFSVRNNTNGTVTATLRFSTGAVYSVAVPAGSTLYHIDESAGDDSPTVEYSTAEDGLVVVNSSGYITALEFPLNETSTGSTTTAVPTSTTNSTGQSNSSTSSSTTSVSALSSTTTAHAWA